MKMLESTWVVAVTYVSLSLSACVKSDDSDNAQEQPIETGNCPDPEAANVTYVTRDPAQCARIDYDCHGGTHFSGECGCGCITPPSPGSLQVSPSGELIIPDSYKACQTDAECTLVETRCDYCCGRDAINAELEAQFRQASSLACAPYRGPVCDCEPPQVEPRCIESKCVALEVAAP